MVLEVTSLEIISISLGNASSFPQISWSHCVTPVWTSPLGVPIHRRAVWTVSAHFCALVSRDHVCLNSIIQSLNGQENKWINQQMKEWYQQWPIFFVATLLTIPLLSKNMKDEDPMNTTFFLFSFLLSLEKAPQLWQQLDLLVTNTVMRFGPWILYIMAYAKKSSFQDDNLNGSRWYFSGGVPILASCRSCSPTPPSGKYYICHVSFPPNPLPTPAICLIMRALKIS